MNECSDTSTSASSSLRQRQPPRLCPPPFEPTRSRSANASSMGEQRRSLATGALRSIVMLIALPKRWRCSILSTSVRSG
eukprot:5063836-Prymnesium_polylepis.1